jgi:hypothetical protein
VKLTMVEDVVRCDENMVDATWGEKT